MEMIEEVFSGRMALGEGAFYCKRSDKLFWTDILEGKLFVKNDKDISSFVVGEYPSCIFDFKGSEIFYLDQCGIAVFDINRKTKRRTQKTPYAEESSFKYRGNDGVMLSGGFCFYGTMQLAPQDRGGALFLSDGNFVKEVYRGIGIPNMFVVKNDGNVLVADSFTKEIFEFQLDLINLEVSCLNVWKDFSIKEEVPDGGCIDEIGHIYLAMWDGASILKLDSEGKELARISLPAKRPTNCVLGKDGKSLFITTASVGLSVEQVEKFPKSGALLKVEL